MKAIRKLLCFLGFHQWGFYTFHSINREFYDRESWWEKTCYHCNKKEEFDPTTE